MGVGVVVLVPVESRKSKICSTNIRPWVSSCPDQETAYKKISN
jgi:hypothetical protein